MIKDWFTKNVNSWNMYPVFAVILIVSLCGYSISRIYGFVLVPDEFAYWAYAAKAAGYDWSDIVSLGAYYSYGYSLLLLPVFLICKNGVIAYRAAVSLNFMLLAAIFFMLSSLAKKIIKNTDNNTITLFTVVSVMYPPLLFFSKTTMAETVLAAMYAATCVLLYSYLEKNKTSTLLLLVLAIVYIYFVHMRAIGITIACVVTIALYYFFRKRVLRGKQKQLLTAVGIMLVILAAGYIIKRYITQNMYAGADQVQFKYNDYAGQIEKLIYIFTADGIINFIVSFAGKLLYLGAASFGLTYWGIGYALREIIKNNREPGRRFFFVFILLSTAAETTINAIYTVNPYRVDTLAYGRYHEFVVPVLMILGLYAMWKSRHLMIGTLAVILSQLPMTVLVVYSLGRYHQTQFLVCMISGMSYAYGWGEFEPISFYWKAYAIGTVLTILLTFVVFIIHSKKDMSFVLVAVIAAEIGLSVVASRLCIDSSARGAYRDTVIAECIEQQCRDYDRRVIYIDENDDALISILQFMLRDKDILIYKKGSEELDTTDIVLLDYRSAYVEKLENKYSEVMIYGHFVLCYNIEGD